MEKEVQSSLYNEFDPDIQDMLKEAEGFGIKISDVKQFIAWINYKVSEAKGLDIVHQKLREAHYDLKTADRLITEETKKSKTVETSETALKKVTKLSTNIKEKERIQKKNQMIGYIFTAAVVSGVGFYVARLMGDVTSEINIGMMGDMSAFFTMFVTGSWFVGIIAAVITVALLAKFFYDYNKYKNIKKEAEKNE
ncbi:MAG: hypothetical protein ABIF40_00765 [archaeon]